MAKRRGSQILNGKICKLRGLCDIGVVSFIEGKSDLMRYLPIVVTLTLFFLRLNISLKQLLCKEHFRSFGFSFIVVN